MNIDREVYQGGLDEAIKRVKFCLDCLEKYGFGKRFSWDTKINRRLTLEEIIGALVSAEQNFPKISFDELEERMLDFCFGKKCIYHDPERPNICKLVVDAYRQKPIGYCPLVKFLDWLKEES